jgi:hypothetical protein
MNMSRLSEKKRIKIIKEYNERKTKVKLELKEQL